MAEVVRPLRADERGLYMPVDELVGYEKKEAHKAFGEYLITRLESGQPTDDSPVLVRMADGQLYAHFFAVLRGGGLFED